MNNPKDILGMPINIGDIVCYARPQGGQGYAISVGKISKLSAKSATIERLDGSLPYTNKNFSKIIVITEQHKKNRKNYPELFI